MRNIMLAIAVVALAALAPFALAAEGQGDNGSGKQPTMAELASKVDSLGTRLGGIEATLGNLATATVGTSATSLAARWTRSRALSLPTTQPSSASSRRRWRW